MGECKNDYGGYFIIDGKEKVIVSQEKFADNILYIRKNKADDTYSFSAEVRSVSEDASKPIRTTAVKIVAPSTVLSNNQVVVLIPNVRKPIPLFILMRALGVVSDQQIIEYCLLTDLTENKNQNSYVDLFIPSVHDANKIFNQETALKFIASFTKRGTIDSVLDILMNYFLPHIGEQNFLDKAYFIGYMVKRLLRVFTGEEKPTDRDNFKYKRVELAGSLIYDLFREYYLIQKREIGLKIDKEFYYHSGKYKNSFINLISDNYQEFFKERTVDKGFKKAFKGNWGAEAHTKRLGVIQDVNRLSWNSFISQMRKFNLPLDASAKVVGPRLLHSSQWGYIDPVDTPDGGNIGLHKHMAISTAVTSGFSVKQIIPWLRLHVNLKLLQECTPIMLSIFTKIFVNGVWVGSIEEPMKTIKYLKLLRRNGILPTFMSISFNYESNEISIFTDAGRLTRPVYYIDDGKPSYQRKEIMELIKMGKFTWEQAVGGFEEKDDKMFSIKSNTIYELDELYPKINKDNLESELKSKSAVVEYLDTAEEEGTYMGTNVDDLKKSKYYTHLEVDPSLILGVLGNFIIFPENNPYPRDAFSCGQTKQAVSLYHSNYQMRIDKMGVVLNSGQIPLIKSRYMDYINKEEQPYGVNAVVAIMSYTGYNVEDAILINEGAIQRGIFRTTYYSMYEAREESSKVQGTTSNSYFSDVMSKNVVGLKPGCDYSQLDKWGLIHENTLVDDKMVVIGKVTSNAMDSEVVVDSSIFPKKGQLGFVDKSFITEGEEGFRIAKVRIREERVPAIGDKMASRAGQKGTLGLIIPEQDMPFTADGIRPDLIINPHAIPSRMTIGQLIESLLGKACCVYGGFGDCTAFANKGPNADVYGHMLVKAGFNASGNQILYNGMTGEQLYSDIYIGPTYYMRLKHMVKDKINYRALGPRTMLTRQTVQGRANDGGLRIGEMERDGVMAHGASAFLNESFMIRGDEYYMAVCNKTGAVAIYNKNFNLFLSPFSDGPISFNTTLDGKMNIRNISRFGRSFSIVRIPYALKLLIQELQVMNVQMRIITEDNIDQLINMSYSNNINELLKSKENLEDLSVTYKSMIMGKKRELFSKPVQKNIPKEVAEYPEIKTEETPEFKPAPPSFSPESPPFAPENTDSPPYAPTSQPNTESSPPYALGSPVYYNPVTGKEYTPTPESPMYNPNTNSSPPYAPENPVSGQVVTSSPPFAPGTPVTQSGGAQPVNITLSIDEVSKLKEIIDKEKEKEFEPIMFETKPKDPPKTIFDVDDVVKIDEEDTSSSSTSTTNDTSSTSSSNGAKKVILL
jgi:DNA-directed RNA polymerase II subunit RPB2